MDAIPLVIRLAGLALLGAMLGSFVNFGIYSWTWFLRRPFSPWQTPEDPMSPRKWLDYVPIIGWFSLRREEVHVGRFYWIRPMLLEIVMCVGLPSLYCWQIHGGQFPLEYGPVANKVWSHLAWANSLYLWQVVLITLMMIATFIDFDEKTIPDQITIPGTLFALFFTYFIHFSATPAGLPHVYYQSVRLDRELMPSLEVKLTELNFATPELDSPLISTTHWCRTEVGLMVALAIVWLWCFALIPKLVTMRQGFGRCIELMLASIVRPPRKKRSRMKVPPRQMHTLTRIVIIMGVFLTIAISTAWIVGGTRWVHLFSSLIGLAVGGGVVWFVRLIASYALQQEAMGFGDVTLMAMVGAFVGWQPSLIIFLSAPFYAILIAIIQFVITRRPDIAFGPYLCISSLVLILFWDRLWNNWASPGIFGDERLAPYIIELLLYGFALMAVVLLVWGWIRRRIFH